MAASASSAALAIFAPQLLATHSDGQRRPLTMAPQLSPVSGEWISDIVSVDGGPAGLSGGAGDGTA